MYDLDEIYNEAYEEAYDAILDEMMDLDEDFEEDFDTDDEMEDALDEAYTEGFNEALEIMNESSSPKAKAKYKAYCKKCRSKGKKPASFDAWKRNRKIKTAAIIAGGAAAANWGGEGIRYGIAKHRKTQGNKFHKTGLVGFGVDKFKNRKK